VEMDQTRPLTSHLVQLPVSTWWPCRWSLSSAMYRIPTPAARRRKIQTSSSSIPYIVNIGLQNGHRSQTEFSQPTLYRNSASGFSWSLPLWLIGTERAELETVSAGPGFNPKTRQNKLFQDYWRSCFEINFSDRQDGLTVSSIICDR